MATMRSMFTSRGKAPRGYQRSDERLREMICERLMEDGSLDASEVEVEVTSGRVTLNGTVDSRMAKYQIEDLVEQIGVPDVQNNLRVSHGETGAWDRGREQSSQQGSSGGASSLGMSASGSTSDRTTGASSSSSSSTGSSGGSSMTGGSSRTKGNQ